MLEAATTVGQSLSSSSWSPPSRALRARALAVAGRIGVRRAAGSRPPACRGSALAVAWAESRSAWRRSVSSWGVSRRWRPRSLFQGLGSGELFFSLLIWACLVDLRWALAAFSSHELVSRRRGPCGNGRRRLGGLLVAGSAGLHGRQRRLGLLVRAARRPFGGRTRGDGGERRRGGGQIFLTVEEIPGVHLPEFLLDAGQRRLLACQLRLGSRKAAGCLGRLAHGASCPGERPWLGWLRGPASSCRASRRRLAAPPGVNG